MRGGSLTALALLLVPALPLGAQNRLPVGVTAGPSVSGISSYRLTNGLLVLVRPDQGQAGITVSMQYGVGWYDEATGERGVAHLLEHLTFAGTRRHPNLRREIAARGATISAATMAERTVFGTMVPPTDSALDWILSVEADRMTRPLLAQAELDRQRSVVLDEVGVDLSLDRRVRAAAFDVHPYGDTRRNADVATAPLVVLRRFHERHYRPDNAVLAIAGNIDIATVLGMVRRHFSAISPRVPSPTPPTVVEPAQTSERTVIVRAPGAAQVIVAYHVPAFSHRDQAAVERLLRALTLESRGRLRVALPRQIGVASVSWSMPVTRQPDLAFINVRVSDTAKVELVAARVRAVLDSLAVAPLSDAEIEAARVASTTYPMPAAEDAASCEIAGDWRLCLARRHRDAAVSGDDVRRVARTYFVPINRTLGMQIPVAPSQPVDVPEGAPREIAAELEGMPGNVPDTGERFVPDATSIVQRTAARRLSSGATLVSLAKRTRGGSVTGHLTLAVGDDASLRGRQAELEVLGAMLRLGTRRRPAADVAAELRRLDARLTIRPRLLPPRATLDPFVDLTERAAPYRSSGIDVRFTTTRDHLPALLALLAELLREPAIDSAELEHLRERQLDLARERGSLPNADLVVQEIVPDLPDGHPERALTLSQRVEAIRRVGVQDLRGLHARLFGPHAAVLAVVGDHAPDSIARIVDSLFAGWVAPVQPRTTTLAARTGVRRDTILRASPGMRGGTLYLSAVLPLGADDPEFAALVVANAIFGGSVDSRLFGRVREREGLSYSIASRLRPRVGEPVTLWTLEATYDLANADRVRAAVRDELARARLLGFTADEVAVAIGGYLSRALLRRGDDAVLAEQLTAMTPTSMAELEKRIARVTPQQATTAFRRFVREEVLTTLAVVAAER